MRTVALIVLLIAVLATGCTALGGGDTALYDRLEASDVALAAETLQDTLETAPDGTSRSWSNAQTGHRGTITPLRTYLATNGHFCREYREVLEVGDASGQFQHAACRDDAERWVWL